MRHDAERFASRTFFCLLALIGGCSSGNGHLLGDGSTDRPSDGGSVGGADGGTNEGTVGGMDGGMDVLVDQGSDSADSVLSSAEQVCQAAIAGQCRRRATCQGVSLDSCLASAALCPDYYFSGASNRTVAGVMDCLAAIDQLTCTDVALGLLPACLVGGTRPMGAGCAYGSQCASGTCSGGLTKCGVCTTVNGAGAACDTAPCSAGTFCHRTAHTCVAGNAILHNSQGQACDLSANPVVGCVGDLLCVPMSSGATAGQCTPAPQSGPCASVDGLLLCAPGLECNLDGTCRPPGGCGTTTCDATAYCKTADGGTSCSPKPVDGEACGSGATYLGPCAAPDSCVASPSGIGFICAVLGKRGDVCDATRGCEFPEICAAGHCAGIGALTCPG